MSLHSYELVEPDTAQTWISNPQLSDILPYLM